MQLTKAFSADISVHEGERAVSAVISTSRIDRDGEILLPSGCVTRDYEKNPVVFFQHNGMALPVGKCVSLVRGEKDIKTKTVFASRPPTHPEGAEWLPDTLLHLFKEGVLNAFSVGFNPVDMPRAATPRDVEKYGEGVRRIFGKWNLLEYSVVTIPANQDAVATAVSKSFDAMRDFANVGAITANESREVLAKSSRVIEYRYIMTPLSEKVERENLKAAALNSAANAVRKAQGHVYAI